jgi:DNA-directed RNA polymerase specialized sigma24 family protein
MKSHDDMNRRIRDLMASADWTELVPRLQAYTCSYLKGSAGYTDPRQKLVDAYVMQAIEVVAERGATYGQWMRWVTLFQLLCGVIERHVSAYEKAFETLVRQAHWDELIPRLIAHTLKRYGRGMDRHGKSAEDYVYDAIETLLTRRRYFPFDRVKLFTFLCNTIRSLHTHEAQAIAGEGAHLAIVRTSVDEVSAGEWNEERLVAPSGSEDHDALLLARDFLLDIRDIDLRRYATLRAFGAYDSASEYAAALGIPLSTIRNWDKRLRRRRDRWGQ